MSGRSTTSRLRVGALLIGGLIAFAAVVEGVSLWVRAVSAPKVEGENAVNTDPMMSWANVPKITEAKAREIAIKEVKQREGWSGKATHTDREGLHWYVIVVHEPASNDYRILDVDGTNGKVDDYRVAKTEKP